MFELNVDYEELEKVLEEAKKEEGYKKLALIRNGIILAVFDTDVYITDIECKGYEIARKTLSAENIDLYCVIIEEKYPFSIIKKTIIQKDIVSEELENYQVIGEHIYELETKELKEELYRYAENTFLDALNHSDAYFEICNENITYNNCVNAIFEQVEALYDEGYTIYTTNNSFVLFGSYEDVMTTNFEDNTIILNKDTINTLINEIRNSDLSENAKKEIISRIKKY